MLVQLNLFAELLAAFPDGQPLEWGWSSCHFVYSAISNCADCKSFYRGRCLRCNAVDFSEWGIDDNEVDVNGYAPCQSLVLRRGRAAGRLAA